MKKNTPKIELHCHLDGSIPPHVFRQLAQKAGVAVPESEEELRYLLEVQPDCKSLAEALERFALPLSVLTTKEAFETATYEILKSSASENVKYIELRYAPLLSVSETLSAEDTIEACVQGIKKAENDFDIKANLILCAMREQPEENNMPLVGLAEKWLGKGVVALDLAGGEIGHPCTDHATFFAKAREKGIPFTIHAGETGDVNSIKEAVKLGASRIGHGIPVLQDEALIEEVKAKNIGIELCPTSNLQTHAVESLEAYPLNEMRKAGVPASVNTDNRTVSNTTLDHELELLENAGQTDDEKTPALMKNCIELIFGDEETKAWLRDRMEL